MPQTSPKNEENLSTRLYAIADYNFAQIVREIKQETNWLNPLVCKTFGKIFISKSIYIYIYIVYLLVNETYGRNSSLSIRICHVHV